jgi:hypothetical protein
MRFVTSLVVLAVLALESPGSPDKPPSTKSTIPVCKANAVDAVFKQVTTAPPGSGFCVSQPVSSIEAGLVQVRRISDHPIIAMAETKGWFFYATSAMTEDKTGEPVLFISGFAVKRNGRHVVGFGVW